MCEKLNTSLFLRLPPFILQAECQNHIRIVAKLSKEVLLVCGTHAYKPKCRHYAFKVSSSAARERRPKTTTTHALESSSRQEFSNCRFLHFAILTKIEAFGTGDYGCTLEQTRILYQKLNFSALKKTMIFQL